MPLRATFRKSIISTRLGDFVVVISVANVLKVIAAYVLGVIEVNELTHTWSLKVSNSHSERVLDVFLKII